ncbi:hypothetical protein D0T51_07905 [Parabacteroides sp. 52]|uniref:hypothetical protein n=1 Tax=unclassified Parabacteroides TaxID=2649774 RepID=UPI0013D4F473|nr:MULTISPECIES: hypothetical protein [unclassified Parabacteroides]MDH6534974.1 hypothetical protein [Parabacteroides sp. PM5-20]NDV55648.1 hypothetical protein [Parabacteroides sp. 52]
MNKIFFITFATISLLFSTGASAQQGQQENRKNRQFDREAFEAKRNAFITAEVGLTPEEASLFIPLCDELRRKKFEIGHVCRKLSREIQKQKEPTKEEYQQAIDECLQAGIKEAQLEKEYYEQFKKILSPEKLYKYREAEFKFIHQFMKDHPGSRKDLNNKKEEKNKK